MTKSTQSLLINILLLTIIFIIIILIIIENYSLFKNKIKNNKLDKEYKKDLNLSYTRINDNRNRKYIINTNNNKGINLIIDSSNVHINDDIEEPTIIKRYNLKIKNKKRNKVLKIIWDSIWAILFLFVLSFSIYSKCNNNIYEIRNKTYITITTGSMSYKNEYNSYLVDKNLNNQIKTFSLISLEKVEKDEDINLYDIYAYKNEKTNKLVVHRIINKTVINGISYYTFRGDANKSSDYYLVESKNVLYHYTGVSNYPLGIIFSYSGSYIGLASITYLFVSFILLDIFDDKKIKLYESYMKINKDRFNKEEIDNLGDTKIIYIK